MSDFDMYLATYISVLPSTIPPTSPHHPRLLTQF
nr:MAG TPA: hypothetical protein [Caudoviricetes sp.]